jgi:hypothetical protein
MCVLRSGRFDELDGVFIPDLTGIMSQVEPEEFIEEYTEIWVLVGDKWQVNQCSVIWRG